MFRCPGNHGNLSLRLSEVFDDIGVNEAMTIKSRKMGLLYETMKSMTYKRLYNTTMFCFGSQSEGTTTIELNSDSDSLFYNHKMIVIQDYAEWQPGLINLLMLQDDTTSPGYCQLQLIRSDLPLPATNSTNEFYVKVSRDKVLLKNTVVKSAFTEENGPAWLIQGEPYQRDLDVVNASYCKSWPREAQPWLQKGAENDWPTTEIKRFAERSGCFVVPTGSKLSENQTLEWRISTSLAERSLVFSFNITQIRCYILMKMILKTYLNSQGEGHLSSFMCKTVLMHCIEKTPAREWNKHNLLKCLTLCLNRLYTCLTERNCPHFIIPGNNLMAGKISLQEKTKLQGILSQIIQNNGSAIFGIEIDDLGKRLQIKLNMLPYPGPSLYTQEPLSLITLTNVLDTAKTMGFLHTFILDAKRNDTPHSLRQSLLDYLCYYTETYRNGSVLEQTASSLLALPICSTLGTIIASAEFQNNKISLSSKAADFLHAGLTSDVSSGRLKQASVFYCMGDMARTHVVLQEISRRYNRHVVEPICGCSHFPRIGRKRQFAKDASLKDITYVVKENTAFCVKFTHAEINCTPHEIQYEMFRSTKHDLLHRTMTELYWMDWAVVDSLPFFHFLQYKTYGQLQRHSDQQKALNDLTVTIATERNLYHRETALNILGQCFEKEKRNQDALNCFVKSLHFRQKNNAASLHICRLLAKIVSNRHD